ncbi:DUF4394 domain-containing protein, partial [Streptomyces sp. NPDC000963]
SLGKVSGLKGDGRIVGIDFRVQNGKLYGVGDEGGVYTVDDKDLNPTEGVWSLVKRDIGNLAAVDLGQITRAVKRKLKKLQYRPEVIDGCLAGTDLALDL